MDRTTYYHLNSTTRFREFNLPSTYAAIVLIEKHVEIGWRNDVSMWLVRTGCLYMTAWGQDCSRWDDSVDEANIEDCNFKRIPKGKNVFTTWHDNESIEEAFWFAKNSAKHLVVDLTHLVILDICSTPREEQILALYDSIERD